MRDLGFSSCLTDIDIWIRAATNPDGYKYWENILVNYDDLLVVSPCNNILMKGFDTAYNLRPETNVKKWSKPTTYIGADSAKFQVADIG